MKNLDLQPGDTFLHFQILRLIGEGGMGKVYEAEHEFTKRRVALKLMHAARMDQDYRERVIQEARTLAEDDHPNVVRLLDANDTDGVIWLAMEYLEGQTLRSLRTRQGPLPLLEALDLLIQVCDGVGSAHERHIIHRDLKPENILVTRDNVAKVIDFGAVKARNRNIVKSTDMGSGKRRVIGTPEYMSPEHLRGERVDERTDTYAIATIAYELLACHPMADPDGSLPETYEVVRRQFIEIPRPLPSIAPHVPPDVWEPIRAGLAKHAIERPSVQQMAASFRASRQRLRASRPDAESTPFEKQWTGPASWAAHGPAMSLPQHVPAPSDPSRRIVVGEAAGSRSPSAAPPDSTTTTTSPSVASIGAAAATSTAPPSPVRAGEAPRSLATPVYAKTQELGASGPGASGPSSPPATVPVRAAVPHAITVMPATEGPAQRASHPANVRARRAGVLAFLVLSAVAVAGVALFFLRGSFEQAPAPVEPGSAEAPAANSSGTPAELPSVPPGATSADATLDAGAPSDVADAVTDSADASAPPVEPAPRASAHTPAVPATTPPATSKPPASVKQAATAKPTTSTKPSTSATAKSTGIDLPFGKRPVPQ